MSNVTLHPVVTVFFAAMLLILVGLGCVVLNAPWKTAATQTPCEARYELRDSGIVGAVIRLDKQTGETKIISVADAAASR